MERGFRGFGGRVTNPQTLKKKLRAQVSEVERFDVE